MEQQEQIQEILPTDGTTPTEAPTLEEVAITAEFSAPLDFNGESNVYTADEFFEGFKGAFSLASDLTNLQSFAIKETELTGARATSDKVYMLANKYSFLHFMIDRRSGWLGDAILIGGFIYGKAESVAQEKAGYGITRVIKDKIAKWTGKKQKNKNKLFGLDFSAQAEAAKPLKPANSPAEQPA